MHSELPSMIICAMEQASGSALVCFNGAAGVLLSEVRIAVTSKKRPNVKDEPREGLARLVALHEA